MKRIAMRRTVNCKLKWNKKRNDWGRNLKNRNKSYKSNRSRRKRSKKIQMKMRFRRKNQRMMRVMKRRKDERRRRNLKSKEEKKNNLKSRRNFMRSSSHHLQKWMNLSTSTWDQFQKKLELSNARFLEISLDSIFCFQNTFWSFLKERNSCSVARNEAVTRLQTIWSVLNKILKRKARVILEKCDLTLWEQSSSYMTTVIIQRRRRSKWQAISEKRWRLVSMNRMFLDQKVLERWLSWFPQSIKMITNMSGSLRLNKIRWFRDIRRTSMITCWSLETRNQSGMTQSKLMC